MNAPPGSESAAADDNFQHDFKERVHSVPFYVGVAVTPRYAANQEWPELAAINDKRMLGLTADIIDASLGECARNPNDRCYFRKANGFWIKE